MKFILRYGAIADLTFGALYSVLYVQKQWLLLIIYWYNVQTRCKIDNYNLRNKLILVSAYSIQKLWLFYYQQFQYKVNRPRNYTLIHILWFFVYHSIVYCFTQTMSTAAYIITHRNIQKWCTGIITINQQRSLSCMHSYFVYNFNRNPICGGSLL